MFQGDEVAAIAADTEERSYDIARLVRVRYEQLPHFANVEQAMAPDAPKVFAMGNTRDGNTEEAGDLDAGFKQAAHVVEQTYCDARHHARAASRRTARCASGTATS